MSKKSNFKLPVNQLTASYRTKFPLDHTVKGSFKHGLLIPFDVIEVLPGDTFKIDVASILRMSTPIAPIMDNIHMHLAAYYVPNRIIYDNWEQLMGVNKTGAWLSDQNTYYVPTSGFVGTGSQLIPVGSNGDYMGLPLLKLGSGHTVNFNALQGRGLCSIWNEYYRSPVVSAPLPVDHTSTGSVLVADSNVNGNTVHTTFYADDPLPLAKYADYFTKCLPQPIKHDPIPFLAGPLDIVGVASTHSVGTNGVYFGDTLGANRNLFLSNAGRLNIDAATYSPSGGAPDAVSRTNLVASVQQNWNTIEALRTAFQLDKFYYKDSYARNYRDMLQAHFSVDNKDSVMQIPQKIGELRWRVNIDQVLSTAGYSATSSTTVGAPGANSVTTGKGSLSTFSVTEHGYIFIVGGTRHDHTYGQGFHKQWTRNDRLDFYDPVFARIGDQPVENREIYVGNSVNTNPFGYQEAWGEYRFLPDRACGLLRPDATGSLDFWTLADNFAAQPQLNETFIYENRNSLARALVTGSTGPDFIFDMFFKITAVREMPLFSVPGLADHF